MACCTVFPGSCWLPSSGLGSNDMAFQAARFRFDVLVFMLPKGTVRRRPKAIVLSSCSHEPRRDRAGLANRSHSMTKKPILTTELYDTRRPGSNLCSGTEERRRSGIKCAFDFTLFQVIVYPYQARPIQNPSHVTSPCHGKRRRDQFARSSRASVILESGASALSAVRDRYLECRFVRASWSASLGEARPSAAI